MKFALACLMLSVMALVVSARNEHHCKKSDAEMKKLIACVIAKVPDASSFYDTLDKMIKELGCTERLCAVRKLCGHEDVEGAFKKYITAAQLELLHGLVDSCSH
ncbi:antimicrobial peptide microplusin-like [Ixodes scapularis]|uniref:antimicrobial peptide microplusin-like n=1 Tax=Ixodes scapularis TaxID=6945 RepID=UPI001A9DBE78|nr:antimicrobial peptide microplusin-like [Ixodes scapularis]